MIANDSSASPAAKIKPFGILESPTDVLFIA